MRVIISGAGIGGLALAQGLRHGGHEVVLVDRGRLPAGASGYRLRLDPTALRSLQQMLPADVLAPLLASAPARAAERGTAFLDHRLRFLAVADQLADDEITIGRGPLQRLLARGLDDAISWETPASSYRVTPDEAALVLGDGREVVGDLVVGADGVHSPLRDQLLGGPVHRRLGVSALGGRVAGTPAQNGLHALEKTLRRHGAVLAFGPNGLLTFLALHDPSTGQGYAPAAVEPETLDVEDGYIVWAVMGTDDRLGTTTGDGRDDEGGPARITSRATELLSGWHPEVRALPALADPDTVHRYDFRAGTPLPVWPTTATTLLGDAVHVVPPTGGLGASTAVRDAGHLVRELAGIGRGPGVRGELLPALRRYEHTMRGYVGEVVERSVAPLRWQRRVANPLVHAIGTGALAAAQRVRRAS